MMQIYTPFAGLRKAGNGERARLWMGLGPRAWAVVGWSVRGRRIE